MKRTTLLFSLWALLGMIPHESQAQRIQQPLGRGIVTSKNGNNVLISWRKLAQEPEETQYNVYVNGNKLNTTPLTQSHYQTTSGKVPAGSQVTVTLALDIWH